MYFEMFLNFAQSQTALNISQNNINNKKGTCEILMPESSVCCGGSVFMVLWGELGSLPAKADGITCHHEKAGGQVLHISNSLSRNHMKKFSNHIAKSKRELCELSQGPRCQGPPTQARGEPTVHCLRQ